MGDGLHNLLTYETFYITPDLFKTGKLAPKPVLKNHSKSQKNRKIENPIVFNAKWVDLYSEHII
jgi:hypothetical protein